MKKYALSIFLFGFCLFIVNTMVSCGAEKLDGASIFKAKCERCHGEDGKKGFNGAMDLTESDYSLEERIKTINKGPGRMPKFKEKLTPEEISAVAEYTIATFGIN